MIAIFTSFIYGSIWYGAHIVTCRYIATKTQNWFFSSIVPLLISVPILLSIILIKPMVGDWQSFIQIWGISFLVGALIVKFAFFNRLYK